MAQSLTDILAKKSVITADESAQIQQEAKEKNTSVDDILYQHGMQETDVAQAKSELTGYPTKSLGGAEVAFEVLRDIPEESARHYNMIPLGKDEGYFDVGMLHPEDASAQEALKFIASRMDLPARIFVVTPSDFQNVLREYQSLTGEVTQALGQFQKETGEELDDVHLEKKDGAPEKKFVEDAPVTKMFSVTLRHAIEGRASDIHIEPGREKLRVRFRVDGVLYTSITLPQNVHSALVTRIKVLTDLKIDETRVPQDGRFHAQILGREIDFRVSTLPTAFGEKVVIRILDPSKSFTSLEDIGLRGKNLEIIKESIERPYGMILITGPTGSGKSTTLYALLQILNQETINIVSLEDPIEYYIPGVNQSQVHPEINYDFASGLRHVVRQDPDIIMVGEIRDKETAALAIHAALTGHLVLSTLHTNTATGVIPRLLNMGIDPFLLAPTLILMIGQRLARRLCDDSRKEVKIGSRAKEIITKEIEEMPEPFRTETKKRLSQAIYQAEVSPACPKGTRGRIGIFETLAMTPSLEQIILSGPSEVKIQEEAKKQGMLTMRQDGVLKVLDGTIGLEELLEVI